MYVSMYACMHACMHACVCVCVCACVYFCSGCQIRTSGAVACARITGFLPPLRRFPHPACTGPPGSGTHLVAWPGRWCPLWGTCPTQSGTCNSPSHSFRCVCVFMSVRMRACACACVRASERASMCVRLRKHLGARHIGQCVGQRAQLQARPLTRACWRQNLCKRRHRLREGRGRGRAGGRGR